MTTLDLDAAAFGRIEQRLAAAEKAGICRFGIHRQNSALMTCIVASPLQRDHIHSSTVRRRLCHGGDEPQGKGARRLTADAPTEEFGLVTLH